MSETKLTTEAVEKLMRTCLGPGREGGRTVRGVVFNFAFDPAAIAEHKAEIIDLLAELPNEFRDDMGGGWSFLNACVDREGNQWGEHNAIDALICLGIAADCARFLMPRDLWSSMPGGMPYFSVSV